MERPYFSSRCPSNTKTSPERSPRMSSTANRVRFDVESGISGGPRFMIGFEWHYGEKKSLKQFLSRFRNVDEEENIA